MSSGEGGSDATPAETHAHGVIVEEDAAPIKEKLGWIRFAFFAFCYTAAGPFGIEGGVKEGGPSIAIAMIFLVPLVHCTPIILGVTELSSWMPSNHGNALWIDRAFGHTIGFINAMVGIISMLVDVSIYPVMGMDYIESQFFPDGLGHWVRYGMTLALILACSIPAFLGTKDISNVMAGTTFVIMVPFLAGVIYGLPTTKPKNWIGVNSDIDFGTTLSVGIWMYTGFLSLGCMGGEVKDHTVMLRGSYASLFFSMMLYLFPVLVALQVTGAWGDGYLVVAFDAIWPGLGYGISFAAFFSAFGLYCTTLISMARGIWGVADIGFLPKLFTYLHPKTGAPVYGILLQMIISGTFAMFDFKFLVVLEMVTATFSYLLFFLAFITLRYKEPFGARKFKIPGGKIGMWLIMSPVFCLWVILSISAMLQDWRVDVGVATMILTILIIYLKLVRGHENKRFNYDEQPTGSPQLSSPAVVTYDETPMEEVVGPASPPSSDTIKSLPVDPQEEQEVGKTPAPVPAR